MENDFRREYASPPSNSARKKVVAPVQREGKDGKDGKTYWVKVGVAFENKDGSWNLYLDAFPFSGKLQMRDWDEPWEGRGRGGAPALPGPPVPLSLPSMDMPAMDQRHEPF
jgi:hypothetical protein